MHELQLIPLVRESVHILGRVVHYRRWRCVEVECYEDACRSGWFGDGIDGKLPKACPCVPAAREHKISIVVHAAFVSIKNHLATRVAEFSRRYE